jgi:PAS domain S-box-containing protein
MWTFFRSLRFRLVLLVLVALLPALIVILYNSLADRRQAQKEATETLRRLVTLAGQEETRLIQGAHPLLHAMSRLPEVQRLDAPAIEARFRRILTSAPALFDNLGVIGLDGYALASVQPMAAPVYLGDRAHVQAARDRRAFAMSRLQYSRILKKPTLVCNYPVINDAGQVIAVLFANLNLDWLQDLAAQTRLPEGSVLTMVDLQGDIMAKFPHPEKWLGQSLAARGLFDLMARQGEGVAEARGMDGVSRLYVFATMGAEPKLGYVFAGIPLTTVYHAANQAMHWNLMALGLTLALALGLSWLAGNVFVMRRLRTLEKATQRLAAGDLHSRTGLSGGPQELTQLAQAFDHLAGSLEQQEAERQQAEREIQRLASFPRFNPNPVLEVNLAGQVTFANPASRDALQRAGGQDVAEFLPPDLGDILAALTQEEGRKFYREVKIGETIFAENIHFVPQFQAVRLYGLDITVRKQAEAELATTKARLEKTFAAMGEMVLVVDPATRTIIACNQAVQDIFGYRPEEVVGRNTELFFVDRAAYEEFGRLLFQTMDRDGWAAFEFQMKRRNGSLMQCEHSVKEILDEAGRRTNLVGVIRDITARRQAEAALRESESLFRSLFDNMLNGFAYHKMLFEHGQPQDFIFLEVNSSFEALTGLKDVVGKKVSEVIPGIRESAPELLEIYGRVALGGEAKRFETYVDIMQKWFAISVYSPATEYFVTVFDDITERKQAEAALRQQAQDLAALFEASRVFLGQTGMHQTLKEACRLAVEHFRLKLAWAGLKQAGDYRLYPAAVWGEAADYVDNITVTWDEDSPTSQGPGGRGVRTRQAAVVNHIDTDPGFAAWRDAALARGLRANASMPMLFGDEVLGIMALYSDTPGYFTPERVQVLQSFANQVAAAYQKARWFEEVQDHADILEQRVNERTAQLQETNAELDSFAYSVAHDLRAPLRAMEGFSQALLEDYAQVLDAEGQEYTRRVVAAAQQMDTLIWDLLEYSRLSRADLTVQAQDLKRLAQEASSQLEEEIHRRQAQVQVIEPLGQVMAHHATLMQVLVNLLGNAIKFIPPGVVPRVRVWAEPRNGRVRLWVEDNGIGIAPEHQGRIFRIFERLHGEESYPGTGIGLAIVRKGLERMGGEVGVESALGQGSKFWLELPAAGKHIEETT